MVPDVAGNRHQGLVALAAGPYIFSSVMYQNFYIYYNENYKRFTKRRIYYGSKEKCNGENR